MGRTLITALTVVAMVVLIVGIDMLWFRGYFWPRLMVNVGIILVFGAFALRFLRS